MRKRYQIDREKAVRQFREEAQRGKREIQLHLPLKQIAGALQEGVGALMREAGLELMQLIMEDEVRQLALSAWLASNHGAVTLLPSVSGAMLVVRMRTLRYGWARAAVVV